MATSLPTSPAIALAASLRTAGLFAAVVWKMTLPLWMNVRTWEPPAVSKTRTRSVILTMPCPPTFTARRKATSVLKRSRSPEDEAGVMRAAQILVARHHADREAVRAALPERNLRREKKTVARRSAVGDHRHDPRIHDLLVLVHAADVDLDRQVPGRQRSGLHPRPHVEAAPDGCLCRKLRRDLLHLPAAPRLPDPIPPVRERAGPRIVVLLHVHLAENGGHVSLEDVLRDHPVRVEPRAELRHGRLHQ